MQKNVYPCLWFDGKAKEAAGFYCSLFRNSKITSENPMVVIWELNGLKVMGLNGGPQFKMNPSISLFVLCENQDETRKLWAKLTDGGKAMMALDRYPWSDLYGWVQDKYGFTWQVSVVYKAGDPMKVTPSFLFTDKYFGKAEAAMKLYTSVFKNSSISNLTLYPKGDVNEGKVMYAEFMLNNYPLIAMDGPGTHNYVFSEGISFVVECANQEEIDHYWEKLTANGGTESMCGWLKDPYGVWWQIVPAVLGKLMSDEAKAPKVMQAFLKMKKFNIAELENA